MNELAEIKNRILSRIEDFITDVENGGLADARTVLNKVEEIINEEFEGTIPLPRFIIHEDGRMEQIKAADEKESKYYDVFRFKKMLVEEDREKFQEFLNEHERLRAVEKQRLYDEAMKCVEVEQRHYENTIHFADAIIRLSQTCGISHSEAKDVIEESIEMLKKQQPKTDPTYISKLTQKAYEDGKRDGYLEANTNAVNPEQIIKDTIKEYIGKPCDDVTELLLALNKDLCERIRKENMNGL